MIKNTRNISDYFWDCSPHHNLNRGPCGLVRNSFGYSPYEVGINYLNAGRCSSDTENCADCPLNPHKEGVAR